METIRITVGGCRNFSDYNLFSGCMNDFLTLMENKNVVILSGHCSGVDKMAEKFANENGYSLEIYPAEWNKYGRAAGPKRNKQMVESSDMIIAFWNGISKGTKNLIDMADKNCVKTFVYNI